VTTSRLVKLTYLEFDLDRMFTDGLFADFAVFYRLLHASRLPQTADTASACWLERYHQDSLDAGARIRHGLSRAVERAIAMSCCHGYRLTAMSLSTARLKPWRMRAPASRESWW